MSPRKYDMGKRAAAVEETRRRIVEATMELHNSQGILATSWEQIAERADVSPATVYRHFPTLEELVPACGRLSLERLELPSDERIEELFGDVGSVPERLSRLVGELFAIYDRGEAVLWSIRRERASLHQLQDAHELIEERLDALTAAALSPLEPDERLLAVARALTDFATWTALREHGIEGADAVDTVTGVLADRLELRVR